VVEVEVSPLSLQPQVRAVWMVADAGRILDLDEARKNVEMGIFQALSWAQGEAVAFHDGALSPMDYQGYLPEPHANLPELWVRFVNTEERNPPKGLGELAFNSVPAAYVAAVSQATGRYLDRIPTTPELLQHYTEEP
jgi:CO/xanthine dehydrogenase Mo-binding subunit